MMATGTLARCASSTAWAAASRKPASTALPSARAWLNRHCLAPGDAPAWLSQIPREPIASPGQGHRATSAVRAVGVSKQDSNTEDGRGPRRATEQIECTVRQPNPPPRSSRLAIVIRVEILHRFDGTGRSPDCPRILDDGLAVQRFPSLNPASDASTRGGLPSMHRRTRPLPELSSARRSQVCIVRSPARLHCAVVWDRRQVK